MFLKHLRFLHESCCLNCHCKRIWDMSLLKFSQRFILASGLPSMCWLKSLTSVVAAITTFPLNHYLKWWICCHLFNNDKNLPSSPSLLLGPIGWCVVEGVILMTLGINSSRVIPRKERRVRNKQEKIELCHNLLV